MRNYKYVCPFNSGIGCGHKPSFEECSVCGWNPRKGKSFKIPGAVTMETQKKKEERHKRYVNYDLVQMFYNKGLNDVEIAKKAGCGVSSVLTWRQKNNLPSHKKTDMSQTAELYSRGLTDDKIGKIIGCTGETVRVWRHENGLERVPYTDIQKNEKLLMARYNQGLTDKEIIYGTGVTRDAWRSWRVRHGLKANKKTIEAYTPEIKELYSQGLTDREIGEKIGFSNAAIQHWRNLHGLPATRGKKNGL